MINSLQPSPENDNFMYQMDRDNARSRNAMRHIRIKKHFRISKICLFAPMKIAIFTFLHRSMDEVYRSCSNTRKWYCHRERQFCRDTHARNARVSKMATAFKQKSVTQLSP